MKKKAVDVETLGRQGRFSQALEGLAERAKSRPLTGEELVAKSRWIQLSEGEEYGLEDARRALEQALELDSRDVRAILELGWFYHAVEDDSQTACRYFDRAVETLRKELLEALVGKTRCLDEMEGLSAAETFFSENVETKDGRSGRNRFQVNIGPAD